MEVVRELTTDSRSRKFKGNENDLNDLERCGILFELGNWELRKSKNYGRNQSWFDGAMITETGFSIDFNPNQTSKFFTEQKSKHLIYIGPWQLTTLTNNTGFPFYQTDTETKLIRFFAYTNIAGGDIQYQFESQTHENKSIPEKKFSLPLNTKIAPDRFGLCVVKWTAKYGYNAIAEVKSKNHFSKDYLVPTGKIIDSETGEIISDESDKLAKTQH